MRRARSCDAVLTLGLVEALQASRSRRKASRIDSCTTLRDLQAGELKRVWGVTHLCSQADASARLASPSSTSRRCCEASEGRLCAKRHGHEFLADRHSWQVPRMVWLLMQRTLEVLAAPMLKLQEGLVNLALCPPETTLPRTQRCHHPPCLRD